MASLEFTIGRLNAGRIRDYLDGEVFKNPEIRYIESTGWLDRKFTIVAASQEIDRMRRDIDAWSARNRAVGENE